MPYGNVDPSPGRTGSKNQGGPNSGTDESVNEGGSGLTGILSLLGLGGTGSASGGSGGTDWAKWLSTLYGIYASQQAQKQAKANAAQQAGVAGTLGANLTAASPIGLGLLGSAKSGLEQTQNYWRTLGMGDRNQMLALLAPQLLSADRQQQAGYNADLSLAPRGAGSPERRLALLDNATAGRNNALLSLGPSAMSSLGATSGAMGNLGSGILGMAGSTGNSLLEQLLASQGLNFNQSRATGQGIFNLLSLLKGTGSASSGTTNMGAVPVSGSLSGINQFAPGTITSPPPTGGIGP